MDSEGYSYLQWDHKGPLYNASKQLIVSHPHDHAGVEQREDSSYSR